MSAEALFDGFTELIESCDEDAYVVIKRHVNEAVEDAVAAFESRRGIVDFAGHHVDKDRAHAEVRMIARWAASLVLGLQRNPDRPEKK
jgi:hypothetical protein